MAISKAQQKAVAKYDAKAYDKTLLRLPKGRLDVVRDHAAAHCESTNAFIGRAISETIERDNGMAPEIAGKPTETAQGDGVVSLTSDVPEAAQGAAKAAGCGIPDKVAAAKSLFGILGSLGDVDLDESRGGRLGVVCLPPDTLKTVQDATQVTGEGFLEFVGRAVMTQAQRDKTSLAMGINPATGGKLEKEA